MIVRDIRADPIATTLGVEGDHTAAVAQRGQCSVGGLWQVGRGNSMLVGAALAHAKIQDGERLRLNPYVRILLTFRTVGPGSGPGLWSIDCRSAQEGPGRVS